MTADQEDASTASSFDEAAEVARTQVPVGYARGDALGVADAQEITARSRTTVVVFAGGVGAGKTTLMATLYERFGRGPIAGFLFAGSATLPGLERRCHGGRTPGADGRAVTSRTPRSALPWLHMRVRDAELARPHQDILLGDFSGEIFNDLVLGRVKGSELGFLRRADHVCQVVDGERLARASQRPGERQAALDLIDALLTPGSLASPVTLSILVTKLDMVRREGIAAERAVDELVDELVERARDATDGIPPRTLMLAARSTISAFPLGHGVDELLGHFTDSPAFKIPENISRSNPDPAHPFAAFQAAR